MGQKGRKSIHHLQTALHDIEQFILTTLKEGIIIAKTRCKDTIKIV